MYTDVDCFVARAPCHDWMRSEGLETLGSWNRSIVISDYRRPVDLGQIKKPAAALVCFEMALRSRPYGQIRDRGRSGQFERRDFRHAHFRTGGRPEGLRAQQDVLFL